MASGAFNYWRPASLNELRKYENKGPLYDYLQKFAWQNKVLLFDDFLYDTATTNVLAPYWAVASSTGTGYADFAVNVDVHGGALIGDTGTDDNGSISLIGRHVAWLGDKNAGVEFRILTDVVTDFNIECGFATAAPGGNASVSTDIDTPAVQTDSAVFTIDTDQTIATAAFITDGSTANQDVKATTLAGIPGFTNGTLPVAATYYTVTIQTVGNSAYCFVNNKLVASHDNDPQGNIEGGTKMAPWVYCRTRSGSSVAVFPQIDYIAVWSDR